MAFIRVPDCAQVEFIALLDGEPIENTMWFWSTVNDVTVFTLTTLVNIVAAAWSANVLPLLARDYFFTQTVARSFDTEFGPVAETIVGAGVGGVDSEMQPNNCAGLITFTTNVGGRSARGRNYIGGLPVDAVGNSFISVDWRADMVAAYEAVAAAAIGVDWQHVVASRFTNGAPRAVGTFYAVASYGFRTPYVRSQRRREL